MYKQGDILLRKADKTETFWLSQRLVMQTCELKMHYLESVRNVYKKTVRACDLAKSGQYLPDSGKGWRWAKVNGSFYYAYDNIPDRKPCFYKSKLGTLNDIKQAYQDLGELSKGNLIELAKQSIVNQVVELYDSSDINYYQYNAEVGFNKEKATQLMMSRAWCVFVKNTADNDQFKTLGIKTKSEFYNVCAELIQPLNLEGLSVSSGAYLRNKVDLFPTTNTLAQRSAIISGKYNNTNAMQVGKHKLVDTETGEIINVDIHQAVMFYAFMAVGQGTKLNMRQQYESFYLPTMQDFDLKPTGYENYTRILRQNGLKLLTLKERHGADWYKKSSLAYVPSQKLQFAHSLYCADGSGTINYRYYNKKGEKKTRKLYVLLITDVASSKIVGWSVADKGQSTETFQMLDKAIKMAMETSNYQTMFEFVSDNHSAYTSSESKDLLNMVFNKVRNIQAGNSQANPAELQFKLFKNSLRGLSNFGSTSWGVSIEGQSNPDYINIDEFPTYEEAIMQFYDIVQRWNETKRADNLSPNERFEHKNPKCEAMDKRVIRYLNANHTKVNPAYMRGFIKVTKSLGGYNNTKEFLFELPDPIDSMEIIEKANHYKSAEVKVVWDEENADLYSLDGKYLMTCQLAQRAIQSQAEADDANENALNYHLARKQRQINRADNFTESVKNAFDSLFFNDEEEYEEELVNELPYTHQMQLGGNKESYNEIMETTTAEKPKTAKELLLERTKRKFSSIQENLQNQASA
ncbi:DDE-type integrase/transposase/recombinase [Flavobacterium covae]